MPTISGRKKEKRETGGKVYRVPSDRKGSTGAYRAGRVVSAFLDQPQKKKNVAGELVGTSTGRKASASHPSRRETTDDRDFERIWDAKVEKGKEKIEETPCQAPWEKRAKSESRGPEKGMVKERGGDWGSSLRKGKKESANGMERRNKGYGLGTKASGNRGTIARSGGGTASGGLVKNHSVRHLCADRDPPRGQLK